MMITLSHLQQLVEHELPTDHKASDLLRVNLLKKLEPQNESEAQQASKEALYGFKQANYGCTRRPNLPDFVSWCKRRLYLYKTLDESLSDASVLGLSPFFGSGKARDIDDLSLFHKLMSSKLTATEMSLVGPFERALADSQLWPIYIGSLRSRQMRIVAGSNFFTVPKYRHIARCAGTEPAVNMAYQLGLGRFIDLILWQRYGYNNAGQPDLNRLSAFRGSLNGKLATIDLSSASDTISLDLINQIFATLPVLRAAILSYRSPVIRIDGRDEPLHMVSTMGNGFTFSLETLVFALICEFTAEKAGIPLTRFTHPDANFGVFGDDIVVPSTIAERVMENLCLIGCVPNREKSHWQASGFRESCGHDYFNGVNVRSIYIKRLSQPAHINSAANRLLMWGLRHGIPLKETRGYLGQFSPYRAHHNDSITAGIWARTRSRRKLIEVKSLMTLKDRVPEDWLYGLTLQGACRNDGRLSLRQRDEATYKESANLIPSRLSLDGRWRKTEYELYGLSETQVLKSI